MTISYEEALLQAQAHSDDTVTGLDCLLIDAEGLDPIRVVNDTQEFIFEADTYHPYGFSIQQSEVQTATVAEVPITIGFFTPEQLQGLRAAMKLDTPIKVTYSYFEVSSTGVKELVAKWPLPMKVYSIDATKTAFSIKLRGDDFVNPDFIKDTITTERFPGLSS